MTDDRTPATEELPPLPSDPLDVVLDIVGDRLVSQRVFAALGRNDFVVLEYSEQTVQRFAEALAEIIPACTTPVQNEGVWNFEVNMFAVVGGLAAAGLVPASIPETRADYFGTSDGQLLRTHPLDRCAGEHCAIHNPSDHPLKDAEIDWVTATGTLYRVCEHRVRHPDPDHLTFVRATETDELAAQQAEHLCDGCCHGRYQDDAVGGV